MQADPQRSVDPLNDPAHEEAPLDELGRLLAEGTSAPSLDTRGTTSDLSLDEILLLHTMGLEPVEVVWGVGVVAMPVGIFTWSSGPIVQAQQAYEQAFAEACQGLRSLAARAGAAGVVGVEIDAQMHAHYVLVAMTGTAVAPIRDEQGRQRFAVRYDTPFLCDLSARDFAVLASSGWYPTDLVVGASFVHAPRRSVGTALSQSTQNVELTNMTETLYDARERAMEALQQGMIRARGTGLVDVSIRDRPVHFAGHVIQFVAWGTAITMVADTHRHPSISVVVPLDERVRTFEASSLR